METNPEIFEGKRFQDLLKDIYDNSKQKKSRLESLMDSLLDLVKDDPKTSAIIVPVFKDLVDVDIRNDEHLVKIATIVQRLISSQNKGSSAGLSSILSDEEKTKLVQEALNEASEELEKELDKTILEEEEMKSLETAMKNIKKSKSSGE